MTINRVEFYLKYLLQVDLLLMVAVVEKKKKMLVGYHRLKAVVDVLVVFPDHQLYHEIEVYNIQPRRRGRRSKLHTDQIRKEEKKLKILFITNLNHTEL
jgi:hypothetical protein